VTRPTRRRSRELALQALYAWQLAGGDALEQLHALGENGEAKGGLAEALVRGVLARADELQGLIAPCLDREFRRLSPWSAPSCTSAPSSSPRSRRRRSRW
jgi:N utilization substance protein B